MKQPTAPDLSTERLYPQLPLEDGQNYRLQKISEIEKTLISERDFRKGLYKKYNRWVNTTDGIDTFLIAGSVIISGIVVVVPITFPLGIIAGVCGSLGVFINIFRRKLSTKSQKHYKIKTIAESKLNSIKNLISKSLNDGEISESEFKLIFDELEKYNNLKEQIHTKHNKEKQISNSDKQKLIEQGKSQAMNEIKKKMGNL